MTTSSYASSAAVLAEAKTLADRYLKQRQADIQSQYEAAVETRQQEYENSVSAVRAAANRQEADLRSRVSAVLNRLTYTSASWTDSAWQGYPQQIAPNAIRSSLRAGVLTDAFPQFGIDYLAMLIPLIDIGSIMIISQGAAKVKARQLLRALVARAVLQLVDRETRFIFCDPVAGGSNFPFQMLPASVRGESIVSQSDDIDSTLRDLQARINDKKTAGRVVLCAADFPIRWSSEAVTALEGIIKQGAAKQIYAILHYDQDLAKPAGLTPYELLSAATIVTVTSETVSARINGIDYPFEPDQPPPAALLDPLLTALSTTLGD